MPWSLYRYQESRQSHFLTFSCYHRLPKFQTRDQRDLFLQCLEQTRKRHHFHIYAYVVMPEHIHLLLSEPKEVPLSTAIQSLKLSMSKRAPLPPPFWQKRYYDHNVSNYEKFVEKLTYIHNNPVTRGLVSKPEDWQWSSFLHYATGCEGPVAIESEWTARKRHRAAGQLPSAIELPRPPR